MRKEDEMKTRGKLMKLRMRKKRIRRINEEEEKKK